MLPILEPRWPAPRGVLAGATIRGGGVSRPPFDTLNLGYGCGDDPRAVAENRRRLEHAIGGRWRWLEQVHGTRILGPRDPTRPADGAVSSERGQTLVVLSADCLPVLLCSREATWVGAVHAGWRGLAAGVLEAALDQLPVPPGGLLAWLGPAISPAHYEVGREVFDAFVGPDPGAGACFRPTRPGHWLADLYALARRRLHRRGVKEIHGGEYCTCADAERFYSYRRDGRTGRMASFIVLQRES